VLEDTTWQRREQLVHRCAGYEYVSIPIGWDGRSVSTRAFELS
jgi:hypothetical protein